MVAAINAIFHTSNVAAACLNTVNKGSLSDFSVAVIAALAGAFRTKIKIVAANKKPNAPSMNKLLRQP